MDCIQPYQKNGGVSFTVWGCFWGRNRGTFTPIIIPYINKNVYVRLLQYLVPPVLQRVSNTLGDPVFQHDNSSIHTVHDVVDWLDYHSVDVEDHTPLSPHLNPIEHVWVELKKRLHQQYPGMIFSPGGAPIVKTKLAEVLTLVWETIEPEFFERLWMSMAQRVEAVIKAKGWHTKYKYLYFLIAGIFFCCWISCNSFS